MCLVPGGLRGQEPTPKPTTEPLLRVAGELTRDDPVDPVLKKGYHKVYSVQFVAGAYYRIDLVSKDFDAYVRLEASTGKQLAEDDDGGGEFNARLIYKAQKGDTCRIIVTTYAANKTGRFLLTVTASARTALDQQLLNRGILSGDAIAGLLLDDLHLATLSACDTGLGDVAGGEGVFGLQRAFHIAGCKNVVASLWKVPDRPTAALMALFYQNLWDKNLPPIEALRQAQLEIYRHPERIETLTAELRGTFTEVAGSGAEMPTGPGGTAHPRIWAAFTLSGAGR
jgi:hypothetical protein